MSNGSLSNPAPLGLTGFGMTTVLLNLHNAGLYQLDTMILAMGIFYGGLAQIIAGIMEFRKGNTFGTLAFCSYGLFWETLVFLLVLPEMGWWKTAPSSGAMTAYLFCWGLFTFGMFFGTFKANRLLQFVLAGWEGIICGASAWYLALAEVLNETYGKTVLPIGEVK